jgi:putative glutamine amidotransferase
MQVLFAIFKGYGTSEGMKPIIGITLDWQASGSFSPRPHYALRQHYFNAIWQAGGVPVAIPLITEAMPEYLARVHGILVPGGDYPSPGWWYGDKHGTADHPRAEADIALTKTVLGMNMPFLGICAGMQTMAVACGGRLHWRVKDKIENALDHRGIPLEEEAHSVNIKAGSLLEKIMGQHKIITNSHHNEGVAEAGQSLVVSGAAEDGVIEAIECPQHPFALGVQWHPEMLVNAHDAALFKAFIAAATTYVQGQKQCV